MQLPGRLAASTLGDLLGALHRERITGQLELFELRGAGGHGVPGRRHRIHFAHGLVTDIESDLPVLPLGEILRRDGLVAAGAIGRVLRRIQCGDLRASGEILVAEGLARPEFIRAGLRKQIKQRLDGLFAVEDAVVTFHAFQEARPRRRALGKAGPLWPSDFLHGRPRLRDRRAAAGEEPAASSRQKPPCAPPSSRPPPCSGTREVTSHDPKARAWKMLGLPEGADPDEVRRAFRRLAAKLHPDRYMSAPVEVRRRFADHFAELSAAYHLLVA